MDVSVASHTWHVPGQSSFSTVPTNTSSHSATETPAQLSGSIRPLQYAVVTVEVTDVVPVDVAVVAVLVGVVVSVLAAVEETDDVAVEVAVVAVLLAVVVAVDVAVDVSVDV